MIGLVKVTLDESIRTNPYKIAEMIKSAAIDIKSCKSNLNTIKDRSWFQRITNNNTADLADAIIRQNDTIQTFFNIVQAIIFLNMNNTYMLGQIMKNLKGFQDDQQLIDNELFDMSAQFLQSALVAAENANNKIDSHEKSLNDISEQFVKKAKLDEEQNKQIEKLNTTIIEKEKIDKEQTERIGQIKSGLQARTEVDKRQNQKIHEIFEVLGQKELLDKTQSEELKNIHEIIINSNAMIKLLDNKTKSEMINIFKFVNIQKKTVKTLSILLIINSIILIGFIAYELIMK